MPTIAFRPSRLPLLLSASLSPRSASGTFGEDLWPGTCEPLRECVIPGER
jgi:hypothetical protein